MDDRQKDACAVDKQSEYALLLSVQKKGVDAMVISKYQSLAMRTSPEDGHDRVLNGCLGLIGESGEIVDLVKKWKFQSGKDAELPKEKLIEECGDVLWYCAELLTGLSADMGVVHSKLHKIFDDVSKENRNSTLEIKTIRLAATSSHTAELLIDGPPTKKVLRIDSAYHTSAAKAQVAGIMAHVKDILEIHCDVTLEDAMENNVQKLKKRYPDGFDPERSLHREE